MRSGLSQDEFFMKMKKKPALQKVLDSLDQYTVEQLETLQGQPKWIREQLVKMKSGSHPLDPANVAAAEAAADNMPTEEYPQAFDMRRWTGDATFIATGNNGMSSQFEYGDLFLVLESEEHLVLWGSLAQRINDSDWFTFIDQTEHLEIIDLPGYQKARIAHLEQKHSGTNMEIIDLTGNAEGAGNQPLAGLGWV